MNRHQRRQAKKQANITEGQSPDQLNQLIGLAQQHQAAERFFEAEESYRKILLITPNSAVMQHNLGCVLEQQNKLEDAATCFEKALILKPEFAETYSNLGSILYRQDELNKAAACYERALILKPEWADAYCELGNILHQQGKADEAITRLHQALALQRDCAKAHHILGIIFQEQNKVDEADAQYRKAIAIEPNYVEVHYSRAALKTFHSGDPDIVALERFIAEADHLPARKRKYIHFALGKALGDVGNYAQAFKHMLEGNAIKRQEIQYDEADNIRWFQAIIDMFSPDLFDNLQGVGDPSLIPIFILGMPRSGSTLIEQILASHPQIQGAGELENLKMVANSVSDTNSQRVPYPAFIPLLEALTWQKMGQAYVKELPPLADGKTRITDKMPINFMAIGLIRLILPNAKIIHIMRDPVDTCFSCFSQLFLIGQNFTYELAELGRYYRRYSKLMDHWRTVLPPHAMLDVSYEALVNDLEPQVRRLIDYCGLSWDDRCLNFYQNNRAVRTASNIQVRRPLYRSSLQRWRNYRPHLGPLLKELSL